MGINNLRIISSNLSDSATLTASSTASGATVVSNLQSDQKTRVWRSNPTTASSTAVSASLTATFATAVGIGGVVLPFTNLSPNATIRVTGFLSSVQTADTGTILACPWITPTVQPVPSGASIYSYGGGSYARAWFSPYDSAKTFDKIVVDIVDSFPGITASGRYIEASRLIMGPYWQGKYNPAFGMTSSLTDLSTHTRSVAGTLVTRRAPVFNKLEFDLKWVSPQDRATLSQIIAVNGTSIPIVASLFPNHADSEMERAHLIYGKVTEAPGITYQSPFTYSTSISIEEN